MMFGIGDDVTVSPGNDSVLCPDGSIAGPGQICAATGVAFVDPANPTLPLCSTMTLPAGFVGPVNCDPSSGPPTYTVTVGQSQTSAAAAAAAACAQGGGTYNSTTGSCDKSNTSTYIMVALGVALVAMVVFGGHGR